MILEKSRKNHHTQEVVWAAYRWSLKRALRWPIEINRHACKGGDQWRKNKEKREYGTGERKIGP